jgi:hypothetical protein
MLRVMMSNAGGPFRFQERAAVKTWPTAGADLFWFATHDRRRKARQDYLNLKGQLFGRVPVAPDWGLVRPLAGMHPDCGLIAATRSCRFWLNANSKTGRVLQPVEPNWLICLKSAPKLERVSLKFHQNYWVSGNLWNAVYSSLVC